MKILFVCNQGMNRSRTAAEMFALNHATKHAGLFCEKPVSEKELLWADCIIVMEEFQRKEIANRFPKVYLQKQILCLDIPDVFQYNQLELIHRIKDAFVRLPIAAVDEAPLASS